MQNQTGNEDSLADYEPFLDELNRVLEEAGEAATLQEFARHPDHAKTLQNACGLAFLHVRDVSKLSPKQLVERQHLAWRMSTIVKLFIVPPEQWRSGYLDFGEGIPPRYVDWLLKQRYPFRWFLSRLSDIVIGRICSAELERRSLERPELTQVLNYKSATPQREAQKYLRERTLSEKARLADKYGLEALGKLEGALQRALNKIAGTVEEKHGIRGYISAYPKLAKITYDVESNFPRYEVMAAETLEEAIPKSGGYTDLIRLQCDWLIRCVAVDYFGLILKDGYSPQEYEASQAISKMAEILKIKRVASRYKGILDKGVPANSALLANEARDEEVQTWLVGSSAENEALQGVYEATDYWAYREVEDTIVAGLEGNLVPSLLTIITRDLKDTVRRDKPRGKKIARSLEKKREKKKTDKGILRQEGEEYVSEQEALEYLSDKLYGWVEDQTIQEEENEPIDLKTLGLDIDRLTPTELQAIERVREGLREGYSLYSKTGNSLRHYLGDDYGSTMRAFNRAKAKLKEQ